MFQRCLNEIILTRLTQASAKSLRCLELDFYTDESVGNQAIGFNCWRTVTERCPSLAVVVRIHGLCGFQKYTSVLVRGIPLSEVKLGNILADLVKTKEQFRGMQRALHAFSRSLLGTDLSRGGRLLRPLRQAK